MTAIHLVVMGVAGCGKSGMGRVLARQLGLPFIEGDAFHPPANVEKMKAGVPLTDDDRAGWLAALAGELRARPGGAVLACSALKRTYRDRLRDGAAELRFLHLALSPDDAQARVERRAAAGGHFYPPSLVASQFEALEDPTGEPGVIGVDATRPAGALIREALRALRAPTASNR